MSGYLLDTNAVSELRKGTRANPGLAEWYRQRTSEELFLSVITLAEIRRGIALVRGRDVAKAAILERWCNVLEEEFGRAGHLLPLTSADAAVWGDLMAIRTLPILDGFLAATAQSHQLELVTRNQDDFVGLPVVVVNPFSS